MKALKIIIIIVVILVAIFLVLGLTLPKDYHVTRSETIEAPKSLVMEQVTSLKKMQEWSPWAELDPNMEITYEGTDGEVGSVMKWEGNKKAGKGMQEITLITDDRVETRLEFFEPFEDEATAYFELEGQEEGVEVTWGMQGVNEFPTNVMMFFMGMEEMIGKDYEKGLASLKVLVEERAASKPELTTEYDIAIVQWPATSFLAKKDTVPFSGIGEFFQTHMPALHEAMGAEGIPPVGAPCGLYYSWDEESQTTLMAVAIPVTPGDAALEGYEYIEVDSSEAAKIAYYGAYDQVDSAHYALNNYLQESQLELKNLVIEEYATDPMQEPDTSKWLTNIYYLVK